MVLKKIPIVGGAIAKQSDGNLTEKIKELHVGLNNQNPEALVQLYPISTEDNLDGVIVKVQPPREPADKDVHHVPCDLVLSIDVSGSMDSPATLPSRPGEDESEKEDTGLSVLDLVKHAARTILETLNEKDRLGIVTFSSTTKVLQPLTPMTAENKAETLKRIQSMKPYDFTNLWHGIRDGLELFRESEDSQSSSTGRVPALLVLTDGLPNHMCPPQGYVPKLQSMEPLPATIHTFGFGYNLKSGLLKSIAELGGGNYSFIPDAGMIGTVFVHAVANLQSTFANNAKLRLTYPSYFKLKETTGEAVDKQQPVEVEGDVPEPLKSLTILLSNLQYGQSRDIYLSYGSARETIQAAIEGSPPPTITAVLEYQHFTPTTHQVVAHVNPLNSSTPSLDPAETAYHISRSRLIAFLSTLCPLDHQHEHTPLKSLPPDITTLLHNLLTSLPASNPQLFTTHPGCRSLLTDLLGPSPPNQSPFGNRPPTLCNNPNSHPNPNPDPDDIQNTVSTWTGQIALALLHPTYHSRWGRHFLPSLAGAHARQVCNSFKDAGPLQYGVDSPLFVRCRDRLDEAFDRLPAPVPTRKSSSSGARVRGGNGAGRAVVSMGRYNRVENGCFAGCVRVLLANGEGWVRVGRLREGMEVMTPRGARRVVAVLRMPVRRAEMCLVGSGLLVTPWHPVRMPTQGTWEFPKDLARRTVRYTGAVYSPLLERDEDVDAHAIMVGGVWGVTMGHGLIDAGERRDVRAHQFYGHHDKVSKALARLPRKAGGVMLGGGLTRDPETGWVTGFSRTLLGEPKAGSVQRKRLIHG